MRLTTQQAMANPAIRKALERVELTGNSGQLDGADEATVVEEIRRGLELCGYRTPKEWLAGARGLYVRVGQRRADKAGTDAGTPDLFVYPFALKRWMGFEVKARTQEARASKEQLTVAELGASVIVSSWREVDAALRFESEG